MKIIELQCRTPQQIAQLVEVWEASVRATHHFLSDAEVEQIKQYVPQALSEVAHLFVAQQGEQPVGFMGIEKDSLEIYVDGASIVLKKYQPACIFCDDAKDVVNFRGKNICPNCLRELQGK